MSNVYLLAALFLIGLPSGGGHRHSSSEMGNLEVEVLPNGQDIVHKPQVLIEESGNLRSAIDSDDSDELDEQPPLCRVKAKEKARRDKANLAKLGAQMDPRDVNWGGPMERRDFMVCRCCLYYEANQVKEACGVPHLTDWLEVSSKCNQTGEALKQRLPKSGEVAWWSSTELSSNTDMAQSNSAEYDLVARVQFAVTPENPKDPPFRLPPNCKAELLAQKKLARKDAIDAVLNKKNSTRRSELNLAPGFNGSAWEEFGSSPPEVENELKAMVAKDERVKEAPCKKMGTRYWRPREACTQMWEYALLYAGAMGRGKNVQQLVRDPPKPTVQQGQSSVCVRAVQDASDWESILTKGITSAAHKFNEDCFVNAMKDTPKISLKSVAVWVPPLKRKPDKNSGEAAQAQQQQEAEENTVHDYRPKAKLPDHCLPSSE